jgi:DNA-binding SARP family transcriptional activator
MRDHPLTVGDRPEDVVRPAAKPLDTPERPPNPRCCGERLRGNDMDGPARFRVALLDGFSLRVTPGLDVGPGPPLPRAVQRLVAYLGLSRRPCRTAVAGRLWPDSSEDHAGGSLRSALWRTQRVAPGLVVVSGDSLSLSHEARVDVAELAAWAMRALDPGSPVEVPPTPGTGSELLPGWYEDWVLLERERIRQLTLHAWEAAAQKLARAARYGEAVEAAYAAVRAEPLRESAHRTLMRVHLAEGNTVEAARVYSAFRTMLADEVGDVPSTGMRRLYLATDADGVGWGSTRTARS